MEGPPGNQSPAEKCEQPVAKLELRSEIIGLCATAILDT